MRLVRGDAARDVAAKRAVLRWTLLIALLAFAGTAFGAEIVPPVIPLAWVETESAAPSYNPVPFTLAPSSRVAGTSLKLDHRLLFAQGDKGLPRVTDDVNATASPAPWTEQKSYLIPALEIVGFDTLLNLFDRAYFGCCDFNSNLSSIRRNLKSSWVVDDSTFTVNQLGHPYQGSMYHGFARASGLNYWEGLAYTFLGSAFWEIAGETTTPSKNDQISTGIGGSFLGEALFRMSNLWLEQRRGSRFWREFGAAAISPPVGFNRLAFDKRFSAVFASHRPEYYSRLRLGASTATQDGPGTSEVKRHELVADFALDYGLPGKPGYTYRRPFDYFSFEASASSAIGFESVMTRGLLLGTDYDAGKNYHGIWGLYGSYDYIAPQIFRMASTALSLGTTAEWRLSRSLALQGTGLLGVGYATVSTVRNLEDETSNHYGLAPQAALALRLIMGDRTSLDLSAREYFVSDVSGGARGGHDNVVRAAASLTWRIYRQHAVAVKYQFSHRDSDLPGPGDRIRKRGTIGIFYTLLGQDRFGVANWQ